MALITCMLVLAFFHHDVSCLTLPVVRDGENHNRSLDTEPPEGQRCWGRHQFESREQRCCTPEQPCRKGEGDCDKDNECMFGLMCGDNNCKQFGQYYHKKDDCCVPDPSKQLVPSDNQRCAGRNYPGGTRPGGSRCCTPEMPCDEGEGDCDGDADGGGGDGNRGCKGDLVCGSNNCKKYGAFYHEKDDCCEKAENFKKKEDPRNNPSLPLVPPEGQRCSGRNYDAGGRGCCTVDQPCKLGEGDCSPVQDGGAHNNNDDCEGDLECGSNNCRKFGLYYHEKDDCCDHPIKKQKQDIACAWFGTCNPSTTTHDPIDDVIGLDLRDL